MKQEEKDLLLKDLCARLPYGVKCEIIRWRHDGEMVYIKSNNTAVKLTLDNFNNLMSDDFYEVKPYLFPLSSMTEEQDKDYALLQTSAGNEGFLYAWNCANMIDWLNKNHFDYNGLIHKGLAIDATNKNIY